MTTAAPDPVVVRTSRKAASCIYGVAGAFLIASACHQHAPSNTNSGSAAARAATFTPAPIAIRLPEPPRRHVVTTHRESPRLLYHRLGAYVAQRYRVSAQAATEIVEKSYAIGQRLKLDPLLILAVIAIESRFDPLAVSDHGAKGLMQVMPRWHAEKIAAVGGEEKVFEPEPNILIGARILKEYLIPTGDVGDALQRYLGASDDDVALEYSERVARERERFAAIAHRVAQIRTAL